MRRLPRDSQNYVGKEAIHDATNAFRTEGFELTPDGGFVLSSSIISRGPNSQPPSKHTFDGPSAAPRMLHWSRVPERTSLRQPPGTFFSRSGVHTPRQRTSPLCSARHSSLSDSPHHRIQFSPAEPAHRRVERALYSVACAVNNLRNKEGTGHGRPRVPTVSFEQARLAVQQLGVIAEYMLAALKRPS